MILLFEVFTAFCVPLVLGHIPDCYVVARVVRKVEMALNVWKHLFLLVSPKSTQGQHGENLQTSICSDERVRLETSASSSEEKKTDFKKIRVLTYATNKSNEENLQVFYLQRRNARSEELQIWQKQHI